jgi:hypothetical protein
MPAVDGSISPDSASAIRRSGSRIFSGLGAATERAGTPFDSGVTLPRAAAGGAYVSPSASSKASRTATAAFGSFWPTTKSTRL